MEEMRNLIGRRNGDGGIPRSRPLSIIDSSPHLRPSESPSRIQDAARSIDDLVSTADHHLAQVMKTQETVQAEVKALVTQLQEVRDEEGSSPFPLVLKFGSDSI